MGMDLYAGTLTRYYCRNWKTIVQQISERNGIAYSRITPDGQELADETEPPEAVQADVECWRDRLLADLAAAGTALYPPWEENNEKPYYTDKPDWDAFGALILFAAAAVYGESAPETVGKNWDFESHPLVRRVMEDREKNWSLFTGATWWLPIEDGFSFTGANPAGQSTVFATAGTLRAELARINELCWQADEEEILQWSKTEGYPADGTIDASGALSVVREHTVYSTESLAKFAFSLFWQAADYALTHHVPLLLDY